MRKILTVNNQVEFHEISSDGVILNIKAFQYGVLHYQIKNGKVVFYSNADENPWRNEVWSVDMPVTIDDEVYSTADEVAEALSAVMNDSYQEQLDKLQEGLATEEGRAQAAEEALQTAIENETSRATSAETNLQSEIASVSATVATFDGRITNVENGLSALTETVNGEITRSTAKDAEHDALISGLNTSLQNEVTRAQGAESALTNSLNNEIARATSAETVLHNEILAERDRALAAENAIDDKVDAEVSRSTAKDSEHDTAISGLNTSIQNEIERATSADTVLHDEILSERDRALAAESGITANLNAEISRATARENAIDNKVDAEVSRSTAKDASQDALISGLSTSLQNEINRAQGAENSLRSDLNAEISARTNAEDALDDKIDLEIQNRIDAVSGLTARVAAEETRASNAETALNEKVNALSAYNASQDAQIEAVTNSINTEISRATSVENAIRSDLNAEISARTNADAAQLQRITALEVGKADANSVYTKQESDAKYTTKDYISGLTEAFFDAAAYDSQTKKINFYHGNTIKAQIDATSFIKDGMVDNVAISGSNLVITFNTDAGKEPISIPLSSIFDPSNYYTKSEIDSALSGKVDNSTFNTLSGEVLTISGDVITINNNLSTVSGAVETVKQEIITISGDSYSKSEVDTKLSNKADLSAFTAHTADSTVHVTAQDKTNWNNKSDFSGSYNDLTDKPTIPSLDGYATQAWVSGFTYDKSEVDASQLAQDNKISAISGDVITLSGEVQTISGNVNTISGDVQTISGKVDSVKTYVAGRAIKINTGTTADTISFNLPIWSGESSSSIIENYSDNKAKVQYSHAEGYSTEANNRGTHAEGWLTKANGDFGSHSEGYGTNASGQSSHAEGHNTVAAGNYSHAEGYNTLTSSFNEAEHACGYYNISRVSSVIRNPFGYSGDTLFSVGNGNYNSKTSATTRHNAFEIRQNGDIYISDTNASGEYYEKPMIKLQDALATAGGSGVTSGEVQTMIDESISGKTNQSDFTAHTSNTNVHVTASEKSTWNAKPNVWCGDETAWSQISGSTESGTIYLVY